MGTEVCVIMIVEVNTEREDVMSEHIVVRGVVMSEHIASTEEITQERMGAYAKRLAGDAEADELKGFAIGSGLATGLFGLAALLEARTSLNGAGVAAFLASMSGVLAVASIWDVVRARRGADSAQQRADVCTAILQARLAGRSGK